MEPMSSFKGTIRKSGNSLVITIPKSIAEGLNFKAGDKATVMIVNPGILYQVRKVIEEKET